MAKKRQYSEREKQAYYAGKGYAIGKAGKRFPCNTEKGKASFRNGVKSVRGKKAGKDKSGIRCKNCGYIVDADGVVVKTFGGL